MDRSTAPVVLVDRFRQYKGQREVDIYYSADDPSEYKYTVRYHGQGHHFKGLEGCYAYCLGRGFINTLTRLTRAEEYLTKLTATAPAKKNVNASSASLPGQISIFNNSTGDS